MLTTPAKLLVVWLLGLFLPPRGFASAITCRQEADLVSTGALCALCADLSGPYDRGGLLEDDEAGGIH